MKQTEKMPVQVVMPEIKLNVADLAFMSGLLPGSSRCNGGHKVTDKLVFLGLIKMADIPPCRNAVAAFELKQSEWRSKAKRAISRNDWSVVEDIPYQIKEQSRPKSKRDYVLTKSGAEFMAKGRARSVTSNKSGCVK